MRALQVTIAIRSITRTTAEMLDGDSGSLREVRTEQVCGMVELAALIQAPAALTDFLATHHDNLQAGASPE